MTTTESPQETPVSIWTPRRVIFETLEGEGALRTLIRPLSPDRRESAHEMLQAIGVRVGGSSLIIGAMAGLHAAQGDEATHAVTVMAHSRLTELQQYLQREPRRISGYFTDLRSELAERQPDVGADAKRYAPRFGPKRVRPNVPLSKLVDNGIVRRARRHHTPNTLMRRPTDWLVYLPLIVR